MTLGRLLKVICLLSLGATLPKICDTVITSASHEIVDGVLMLCPDTPFSLTCSYNHTNEESSRWEFKIQSSQTTIACPVTHNPPNPTTCGEDLFNINNISDVSEPVRSSTAQGVATDVLDGAVVFCREGAGASDRQIDNVTIRVGPIDRREYFVDSTVTGGVRLTVSGPETAQVNDSGASVEISGSIVTVTRLDYTESYLISVTANSPRCPGQLLSSSVSVAFHIEALSVHQPVPSIICSNPSLPIQLTWTIDEGVQSTTDLSTPLTPTMIGLPVVSFTSSSGRMNSGSGFSFDTYTLPNPIVNDNYTFIVSVRNTVGATHSTEASVKVSALNVDVSKVSSEGCLGLSIRTECAEDVGSGDFSVTLVFGTGLCQTVNDLPNPQNATRTIISPSGVCIPVGKVPEYKLCYDATVMYQGTMIMSEKNQVFENCNKTALKDIILSIPRADSSRSFLTHDVVVPNYSQEEISCRAGFVVSGNSSVLCLNGNWMVGSFTCTQEQNLTVVWVIVSVVFVVAVAVIIAVVIFLSVYVVRSRKSGKKLCKLVWEDLSEFAACADHAKETAKESD